MIYCGSTLNTRRVSVLQCGQAAILEQHSGGNYDASRHSTGESHFSDVGNIASHHFTESHELNCAHQFPSLFLSLPSNVYRTTSDFVCSCAVPRSASRRNNISKSTDVSSVLFDDSEHGIIETDVCLLNLYFTSAAGMHSVLVPP